MNILEIKNLYVYFQKFAAVRGVSLAVKPAEFVALVGNSGSGKSTIAQAILKLQSNATYEGQILFKRQNLLTLSESRMQQIRGSKIAMIFQEPMTCLNPLHTAGAQIGEVLTLHGLPSGPKQVMDLLQLVELTDIERIYRSFPHELSGGQRQRVMIAMALAGKPDILIADEPTTALDVRIQAQILALLKILQQKLGLAVLFITHDLNIVRKMADRLYVLRGGKVIATRLPPPEKRESRQFVEPQDAPILAVKDLSVRYGVFEAVRAVSFQLHAGQTLGLVGESGCGKSSLVQGLMRLIPATGQVLLNGRDFLSLKGRALTEARSEIQMVLQDPAGSLNPRMTVREIIAEGIRIHRRALSGAEQEQLIRNILKAVDLRPDLLNRYPHELSGGQKTRVALARALVLNPKVLILDEVTVSLDESTQKQLIQLLIRLQKRYHLVYVFISHDIQLVRTIADYVAVMKQGQLIEQGKLSDVMSHPRQAYTKELITSALLHINLHQLPV